MKKRILPILLTVCMIICMTPAAWAVEIPDSDTPSTGNENSDNTGGGIGSATGTCGAEDDGSNLTYTLDNSGTLTISGTGAMADYSSTNLTPWSSYNTSITKVVINEGVTSVGNYAFNTYSSITEISLPNTLTRIGNYSFDNCQNITSVVIPNSVTEIGSSAFYNCNKVTGTTIPASVTKIGMYAFNNWAVTSIGPDDGDYDIKYQWTDKIPDNAFYGCSLITDVTIPGTITEIGSNAFASNRNLKNVNFSEGTQIIGASAFYNCNALTNITLPSSITSIGQYAFGYMTAAKTITFKGNAPAFNENTFSSDEESKNDNVTIRYPYGAAGWETYSGQNLGAATLALQPFATVSMTASPAEIEIGTTPAMTITATVPFATNPDGGIPSNVHITSNGTGLTSAGNFSVNDKTMTFTFDNPASAAGNLQLAFDKEAFNVDPSEDSILTINIPVTAANHNHTDIDNDGFCDESDNACLHTKNTDTGYCSDADCTHDRSCTCGGKLIHIHVDNNKDGFCDNSDGTCDLAGSTNSCLHEKDSSTGYCVNLTCIHNNDCFCGGAKPHEHSDIDNDGFCDNNDMNCTLPDLCMHTKGSSGFCTNESCVHDTNCACGGSKSHEHADADNDGFCDNNDNKCNLDYLCMHTKDSATGYCSDSNCVHENSCACGGKYSGSGGGGSGGGGGGGGGSSVNTKPTEKPAEAEKPEPDQEQPSPIQSQVKEEPVVNWFDRVDTPDYVNNFYDIISSGSNADGLTDYLINDDYTKIDPNLTEKPGGGSFDVEQILIRDDEINLFFSGTESDNPFDTSTLADDGFYNINMSAGDKAIDYNNIKEGDFVRTASFNGIYITKVTKLGNKNYESDLKNACAYATAAFHAFDMDHPEVFWLSGKSKLRMITVKFNGGKTSETFIFFTVADKDKFTIRSENYSSQSKIEEDIKLRDTLVDTIIAETNSDNIHTRLSNLNRYLTEHNEYNTSKDLYNIGNDPHECLRALMGSVGTTGPVCDGYARAFKVLCDKLKIPCVLVTGYARYNLEQKGEFHMWNSVQMTDENWYGVDVTWNDPTVKGVSGAKSGRENENYLLVGANTEIRGLTFSVSHPPSNKASANGVSFINGPVLSLSAFQAMGGITEPSYSDVPEGKWYCDAVNYVSINGLMQGVSNNTFAPDSNLSRAMLAQILYNKEDRPASESCEFSDVPQDKWFSAAVSWAASEGIVTGYTDGRFGPDDNITREQLTVMLHRYAGSPAPGGSALQFSYREPISEYAANSIAWAMVNGIMHGKGDRRLDPKGLATRAETAQMIKNYLDR